MYRYDDPFWATFYPPNGYRCRCSVTALSEHDIQSEGLTVQQSNAENLVDVDMVYNKKGDTYATKAFKTADGRLLVADRGFDYNVGRMNYRPDLDKYDRALAHQFAKAEMTGPEFKQTFKQLSQEFYQVKQRLGIEGKVQETNLREIRNSLSRQLKFAAGVLSPETQQLTGIKKATVWLSDDTLVKQVNSSEGQDFDVGKYAFLPDLIEQPDMIFVDEKTGKYFFSQKINQDWFWTVFKYLRQKEEIFLESFSRIDEKTLQKLKYIRLK